MRVHPVLTPLLASVTALAVPIGTALVLTACTSSASPSTRPNATAIPTPPPTQPQIEGSGSGFLRYDLVWPTNASGSTPATIDCSDADGYRIDFGPISIGDAPVTGVISIADYRGPGRYDAIVQVDLPGEEAGQPTPAPPITMPITITATGGVAELSDVPQLPKAATGSVTWTCG